MPAEIKIPPEVAEELEGQMAFYQQFSKLIMETVNEKLSGSKEDKQSIQNALNTQEGIFKDTLASLVADLLVAGRT